MEQQTSGPRVAPSPTSMAAALHHMSGKAGEASHSLGNIETLQRVVMERIEAIPEEYGNDQFVATDRVLRWLEGLTEILRIAIEEQARARLASDAVITLAAPFIHAEEC